MDIENTFENLEKIGEQNFEKLNLKSKYLILLIN